MATIMINKAELLVDKELLAEVSLQHDFLGIENTKEGTTVRLPVNGGFWKGRTTATVENVGAYMVLKLEDVVFEGSILAFGCAFDNSEDSLVGVRWCSHD